MKYNEINKLNATKIMVNKTATIEIYRRIKIERSELGNVMVKVGRRGGGNSNSNSNYHRHGLAPRLFYGEYALEQAREYINSLARQGEIDY
jgi:hypothetical protein